MSTPTEAIPAHLAPQRGDLVLFENPLLERLSRIRPGTVLGVYVPVAAVSFYLGLRAGVTASVSVWLAVAGAAFWTLFEYFFHRFVFHFYPSGKFQTRLQFLMHGVHHQYPNDRDRLVMPITVSIPTAALLLGIFHLLLGSHAWSFFTGFVVGYLAYDMMHYSIHHWGGMKNSFLRRIRKHHMAHHFRDTRKGFGVSSPFWDRIFRT